MKIKSGFLLRQSGEKYEIINAVSGEPVLTDMTDTELFLWEKASGEFSEQSLISAILVNFCVDGATAELEVSDFIFALRSADAI